MGHASCVLRTQWSGKTFLMAVFPLFFFRGKSINCMSFFLVSLYHKALSHVQGVNWKAARWMRSCKRVALMFLWCPARSWQWKISTQKWSPDRRASFRSAIWLIWQTNFRNFWHRKFRILVWVFAWKMGFLLGEIEFFFFFLGNLFAIFIVDLGYCGVATGKILNRGWIST